MKGRKGVLRVRKLFYILTVTEVMGLYTVTRIHQTVCLKWVNFIDENNTLIHNKGRKKLKASSRLPPPIQAFSDSPPPPALSLFMSQLLDFSHDLGVIQTGLPPDQPRGGGLRSFIHLCPPLRLVIRRHHGAPRILPLAACLTCPQGSLTATPVGRYSCPSFTKRRRLGEVE